MEKPPPTDMEPQPPKPTSSRADPPCEVTPIPAIPRHVNIEGGGTGDSPNRRLDNGSAPFCCRHQTGASALADPQGVSLARADAWMSTWKKAMSRNAGMQESRSTLRTEAGVKEHPAKISCGDLDAQNAENAQTKDVGA